MKNSLEFIGGILVLILMFIASNALPTMFLCIVLALFGIHTVFWKMLLIVTALRMVLR